MIFISADATFKICIFGNGGVGKTSLTKRYLTGMFEMDTLMTLGAAINVHYITIDGFRISLQIWDFGGEKQFQFLLPVYAHGSSAAIFMYDVTRYDTLKNIDTWLNAFMSDLSSDEKQLPIMMIGGKIDLEEQRSVKQEDAKAISEAHDFFQYLECSAKTGHNVNELFESITREMLRRAGMI